MFSNGKWFVISTHGQHIIQLCKAKRLVGDGIIKAPEDAREIETPVALTRDEGIHLCTAEGEVTRQILAATAETRRAKNFHRQNIISKHSERRGHKMLDTKVVLGAL